MDNKKPWYENIVIWISIIAGVCTILTFIISYIIIPNKSNKDKDVASSENNASTFNIDGDKNIIIQGNNNGNINFGGKLLSDSVLLQETKTTKSIEISEFNFGKAIRHIHKNELIIKKKIINNNECSPIYSSIYPGVNFSEISNKIRLVEVAKSFRNIKCSRLYHFDEKSKLTFALIEDNKGEHRLYFYNDKLIRYIDINNKVHDINYDLENFDCKWTELALKESYEIYNGI